MNRKTMIANLLAKIGDHEHEEAFRAIESIESRPCDGMLKIRFHISAVARMTVRVDSGELVIEAAGMNPVRCEFERGIQAMRKFMHDLDGMLADGYRQPEQKLRATFFPPPPPPDMDLPTWDEATKTWYDAEV